MGACGREGRGRNRSLACISEDRNEMTHVSAYSIPRAHTILKPDSRTSSLSSESASEAWGERGGDVMIRIARLRMM